MRPSCMLLLSPFDAAVKLWAVGAAWGVRLTPKVCIRNRSQTEMTPLPPVADVLKYTQNWEIGSNHKAESILYFQYTGGPPSTSACQALAADIQAAMVSDCKALMSSAWIIGPGTVLDINSNTGAEGTGGTPNNGTRTGSAQIASACVVINHAITRRYRGGKPRTYAPFLTETDLLTVGTWQSSSLTAVTTGWASFVTTALASSSGGVSLTAYGAVSYFLNGAPRTTPVFEPITASSARQVIGSQRRRLKGA